MTAIAFFRNLNQGQRGSPTSAELTAAFVAAGAAAVSPFQGNGTVVYSAHEPEQVLDSAVARLRAVSPWQDVAFARTAGWLTELIDEVLPGSVATDDSDRRMEVSLFSETTPVPAELPIAGRRCDILRCGQGFAVTVNERDHESNGTPTLERLLGVPVTSRGVPTLRRLAVRLLG